MAYHCFWFTGAFQSAYHIHSVLGTCRVFAKTLQETVGRKEGRLCEEESRQQPDVVQLISREIFHQPRWELASCSKSSRRSGGTRTTTLLARDSNFLYLWNGFYVYVYVSAIVYSWNYLSHVKELALRLSCLCNITGIRYAVTGIFHVDVCCYLSFVFRAPYFSSNTRNKYSAKQI